jgi:hypothetical protein
MCSFQCYILELYDKEHYKKYLVNFYVVNYA